MNTSYFCVVARVMNDCLDTLGACNEGDIFIKLTENL